MTAIGPTGDETILGMIDKRTGVPVLAVGADRQHMKGLKPMIDRARAAGEKVKLLRFSNVEVVDESTL